MDGVNNGIGGRAMPSLGLIMALLVLVIMFSTMVYSAREDAKEITRKRNLLEPYLLDAEFMEAKQMLNLVLEAGSWAKRLSPSVIRFKLLGGFMGTDREFLYTFETASGMWRRLN